MYNCLSFTLRYSSMILLGFPFLAFCNSQHLRQVRSNCGCNIQPEKWIVHLSIWVASKTPKRVTSSFPTQNKRITETAQQTHVFATYSSWTVQRSQWQEARTKLNSIIPSDEVALGWFTWLTFSRNKREKPCGLSDPSFPKIYGLWKASAESELWSRRRLWCGDLLPFCDSFL